MDNVDLSYLDYILDARHNETVEDNCWKESTLYTHLSVEIQANSNLIVDGFCSTASSTQLFATPSTLVSQPYPNSPEIDISAILDYISVPEIQPNASSFQWCGSLHQLSNAMADSSTATPVTSPGSSTPGLEYSPQRLSPDGSNSEINLSGESKRFYCSGNCGDVFW
jgi:hypothetical protein